MFRAWSWFLLGVSIGIWLGVARELLREFSDEFPLPNVDPGLDEAWAA